MIKSKTLDVCTVTVPRESYYRLENSISHHIKAGADKVVISHDIEIVDSFVFNNKKRQTSPLVSVVMPVYNAELYVFEAVESILQQTFEDFEFIIVDDASTDNTRIVLDKIQDSRIVRINNTNRTGNYKCRNQALDICKGKYVCVMDADDISYLERLRKQYEFMENYLEYAAIGSDILFFSEQSSTRLFERLRDPDEIKVSLLKDNVATHPSLIIRKDILEKNKIRYNEEYFYSGDYDLLVQISRIGNITNYPEPLLQYRLSNNQISQSKRLEQMMYADRIRLRQLSNFCIKPSIEEILIHLSLMNDFPISKKQLEQAEKWCNKLLVKNNKLKIYKQESLYNFLGQRLSVMIKYSH